jgi:MFS family permease
VLGGKLMDVYGKTKFYYPVASIGVIRGLLCYFIKFVEPTNTLLKIIILVIGGTLIMGGSMLCSGLFYASSRDHTPKDKAGSFQGIRMVIVIMTPMILASLICPFVIESFGTTPTPEMIEIGAYRPNDKVYPYELFLISAIIAALVFVPAIICKIKEKAFRSEKLKELNLIEKEN